MKLEDSLIVILVMTNDTIVIAFFLHLRKSIILSRLRFNPYWRASGQNGGLSGLLVEWYLPVISWSHMKKGCPWKLDGWLCQTSYVTL